MIIGIDLTHSSRWTMDSAKKPSDGRAQECAELDYLGHVAEVMTEAFDATIHLIDDEWMPEMDLLIVPEPDGEHGQVFSLQDSKRLERFVASGGGVLVLGAGSMPAGSSGDAPSIPTSLQLGDSLAGRAQSGADAHLLTYEFFADAVPGHPIASGVRRVYLHRPRRVYNRTGAMTPVVRCDDATVIAIQRQGPGRVGIVGNAELFALPFLGRADNARLLVNLVSWLAVGEVLPAAKHWAERRITTMKYAARSFAKGDDLERIPGAHLVDMRPHRSVLDWYANHLPNPYEDEDTFLTEAELRYHELPRVVRQAVTNFRHHSNDYGVLFVKGLPPDPKLPPTPSEACSQVPKGSSMSELWLAAFTAALGGPISFQQEKQGQLFQNVMPTRQNATKLSSESSAFLLDFHTEAAFHPYRPDYVMLYCLRPDHDRVAKTIIAGARMILSELALPDRAVLFEPLFRTGVDYSFGSPNGTKGNGPLLPVLYGDPYDPYLIFDLDLMTGVGAAAEQALQNLRAAANKVKRWVKLDRGDLLIVDNRRAVHGRSEFVAKYDGFDRWLQRMCVVTDLAPSAPHRRSGGRVIETAFAV